MYNLPSETVTKINDEVQDEKNVPISKCIPTIYFSEKTQCICLFENVGTLKTHEIHVQ